MATTSDLSPDLIRLDGPIGALAEALGVGSRDEAGAATVFDEQQLAEAKAVLERVVRDDPTAMSDNEIVAELARLFDDCLSRIEFARLNAEGVTRAAEMEYDVDEEVPTYTDDVEAALQRAIALAARLSTLVDQFVNGGAGSEVQLLGWNIGLKRAARDLNTEAAGAILPDATYRAA